MRKRLWRSYARGLQLQLRISFNHWDLLRRLVLKNTGLPRGNLFRRELNLTRQTRNARQRQAFYFRRLRDLPWGGPSESPTFSRAWDMRRARAVRCFRSNGKKVRRTVGPEPPG
jgi:hypothetical protein